MLVSVSLEHFQVDEIIIVYIPNIFYIGKLENYLKYMK